jgi:peptide/nickel transport system substrate-binding protein
MSSIALSMLLTLSAPVAHAGHGIAMHGMPMLAPGFTHLPYVNPEAPKGGRLRLGTLGSFDSLNVFIARGSWAEGIREHVYETLLARNLDEPFSLYGLLAESVDMAADRSAVSFSIRAEARFSDGAPVTADDVIHSFELLKSEGAPFYRSYYGRVARVLRLGEREVRFELQSGENRELPLILGLMPIFPRHLVTAEKFKQTTMMPPVGSGPYVVAKVTPGRLIVLKRNPAYWGRALPMQRGRNNFDEIRYEYFSSQSTLFEAFRTGTIDVRLEDQAQRWAAEYEFAAVKSGRVVKRELRTGSPAGMNALVFNTRRPLFRNQAVRRAIALAFDFNWINANLYHGRYSRTRSFFERSELSSVVGKPSPREVQLLEPFKAPAILPSPAPAEPASERERFKAVMALLAEGGYALKDGKVRHRETGIALAFEVMIHSRAHERLLVTYASLLARLGIDMRVRMVDDSQFWNRAKVFDFDMMPFIYSASLSPGSEQVNRWSSTAARIEGSLNFAGVEDPAVDAMLEALLKAETREDFAAAARSLDRVLIAGDYVVPLYYAPSLWVAHWRHIRQPDRPPLQGLAIDTWWSEPSTP